MTHSGLLVLNLPSLVSLQSLPLPKAGWWYPSKFPACHPLQGHCGHLMLSLWGPDWLRRPQLADSTLWVLVQETEGEHGSDRHRHRRGSQAMSLLVQTKRAKLFSKLLSWKEPNLWVIFPPSRVKFKAWPTKAQLLWFSKACATCQIC